METQSTLARYGIANVDVEIAKTAAQDSVTGECLSKWHSHCLDGSGLSVAGVRGIIAGGVLFIVIVVAAGGIFYYRRKNRDLYAR